MHAEAYDWISLCATTDAVAVLDIGGRDINGSPRPLFPHASYMVLDIADGPNVDIVVDASTWIPDRDYDVVVCAETFEHTPVWPQILATAYKALRPGGRLIVTTAAPGRPEHSAVDGGPLRAAEYYGNVESEHLRRVLDECGFTGIVIDQRHSPADVRATAVR